MYIPTTYANPALPLSNNVILNERLSDMVNNEGLVREERNEFSGSL